MVHYISESETLEEVVKRMQLNDEIAISNLSIDTCICYRAYQLSCDLELSTNTEGTKVKLMSMPIRGRIKRQLQGQIKIKNQLINIYYKPKNENQMETLTVKKFDKIETKSGSKGIISKYSSNAEITLHTGKVISKDDIKKVISSDNEIPKNGEAKTPEPEAKAPVTKKPTAKKGKGKGKGKTRAKN